MMAGAGTMIDQTESVIEQWGCFEARFRGPVPKKSFWDHRFQVCFTHGDHSFVVNGFYDGGDLYLVRFMPPSPGSWRFETRSDTESLNGLVGSFTAVSPSDNNHGPVVVEGEFGFAYADGTSYMPYGTTCYGWVNQPDDRVAQTLQTLQDSPFNKIRFCVFPKNYEYNREEPPTYPFVRNADGSFQLDWLNPVHFQRFDAAVVALCRLGIEADIILFHPYDFGKWGFDTLPAEVDDAYLEYIIARLGAFRNVWWSMANEFDLLKTKTDGDWERLLSRVAQHDPYHHLRSIHNCVRVFDHTLPLISHVSMQSWESYKFAEWRTAYRKPIVLDECCYEGDVEHSWGSITAEEMVFRFWNGMLRGGFVGHSETYWAEDEVLWWGKGGILKGQSAPRIAFLREIVDAMPWGALVPQPDYFAWDWLILCAGDLENHFLVYFGKQRPKFREFILAAGSFKVELIDTWNMQISTLQDSVSGTVRVELPSQPYMALRFQRVSE